jgi:hypothetical protein
MKVSGFTVAKNIEMFDFPAIEAITSILPACDEFIVNIGDCQDNTLEMIRSIPSDKVRIVQNVWDPENRRGGREITRQTNIALKECRGDWAFYIQADEVVHEKYLDVISKNLKDNVERSAVEGFTFNYVHFYGRHDKVVPPEADWYKESIRIVRNNGRMISDGDGTSFRKVRNFSSLEDLLSPKVRTLPSGAEIYHYGWVRSPKAMQNKIIHNETLFKDSPVLEEHPDKDKDFDYPLLSRCTEFKGTHPSVMKKRIERSSGI